MLRLETTGCFRSDARAREGKKEMAALERHDYPVGDMP
jgi:hypothetical protein